MASEVEVKHLVHGDEWRRDVDGAPVAIVQGYLHVDADREVRVRVRDGAEASLTVKWGGRARERGEVEVPLGLDAARSLLADATVGQPVRKRRHRVPVGDGLVAEVDEFEGELSGLVLAEVELPDGATTVPDVAWFGPDVTGDERYYNATLATEGLPA